MKRVKRWIAGTLAAFVLAADLQYARLYFEEANVTQRREQALRELASHPWSDTWDTQVVSAGKANAMIYGGTYSMTKATIYDELAVWEGGETLPKSNVDKIDS